MEGGGRVHGEMIGNPAPLRHYLRGKRRAPPGRAQPLRYHSPRAT
ncbi:hypothetical protein P355_0076 [Burkholderia cenocepacia KC-01]|nr:hypothetical protein P355_0076 [Burkholderia cenocepacia KC-01]